MTLCLGVDARYNTVKEKMMEWVSVEDRLPEKTGKVLVYYENSRIDSACFAKPVKDFRHGFRSLPYVTHWMPLPEPPNKTLKRRR